MLVRGPQRSIEPAQPSRRLKRPATRSKQSHEAGSEFRRRLEEVECLNHAGRGVFAGESLESATFCRHLFAVRLVDFVEVRQS